MAELIITEKPQAAKKIAEALADGKAVKKSEKGVPYYLVTHGKKDIIVGCAVGHLYTLVEKNKAGWKYPVFDVEWVDSGSERKESSFTKKYLSALKKLSKQANEFTVATDLDTEGEVIGLNILRFACKQKDANRMKFSTLTKDDLVKAYENKSPTIDWGLANAGETRHILDWIYGINTSRALTTSIKTAGLFKIMSTGRVQGPALKIIVDREKEILAFKPVPFWQISLNGDIKSQLIEAWHEKDKFRDKKEADSIFVKVKNEKKGLIDSVKKKEFDQSPPIPFDLTSLQIEAYRCLRIQPKNTLSLAQDLYTAGFISYPRTSSQQLPKEIGYNKILSALGKNEHYTSLIKNLLSKKDLQPNNGKKTDPAHPAIYPTGILPTGLKNEQQRLYDLIARRFMATFAEPALRETMTIKIDVKSEFFITKGTRTKIKGWHVYYEPYLNLEEQELPKVEKNDQLGIKKITLFDKETQPPKRYTQASIIKELEKKNLGTKATRAQIVDTLFQRGYVSGLQIKPSELGIKTTETLEKHVPRIVDEELTSHFETEMDEIRENNKKGHEVIDEAKVILGDILKKFKDDEKEIGKELADATKETREREGTVGKCPNCTDGTLMVKRGKFGMFAACNKYPDCKTTFSLPSGALVKVSEKVCEQCKHPMIMVIRKAKRPQELCINNECPSKKLDMTKKERKAMEKEKCPTCKEGNLVLRKSIYGEFYGCSRYPKCRFTKRIAKEKEIKEEADKPEE